MLGGENWRIKKSKVKRMEKMKQSYNKAKMKETDRKKKVGENKPWEKKNNLKKKLF